MNYVDEQMFDPELSFDPEDLSFDDMSLDEMGLDSENECPRCGTELEAADELEHIEKHGMCPSCLSDLALEAAEDAMGM